MSEAIHTALSALRANLRKLDVTANNLANANTQRLQEEQGLLEGDGPAGVKVTSHASRRRAPPCPRRGPREGHEMSNVSVEEELVDLIATRHAFAANSKDDPGGRRDAGHTARHPRLSRSRTLPFELLFSPHPPVL
jgi:flagellar basal body rod protein FlgG